MQVLAVAILATSGQVSQSKMVVKESAFVNEHDLAVELFLDCLDMRDAFDIRGQVTFHFVAYLNGMTLDGQVDNGKSLRAYINDYMEELFHKAI
jgi:hypothetical protein